MQDGIWTTDPREVKEIFRNHFQKFFNVPQGPEIFDPTGLVQRKLTERDSSMLEEVLSIQEVHEVVMSELQ